jgi:ParB-like chromosome segregation protein Spo0J
MIANRRQTMAEKIQERGLAIVPIESIRVNPISLRDVQRDSEKYEGLKAAVREMWETNQEFLGTIIVRPASHPIRDAEGNQTGTESYYEIVDGLQRYSASLDLKLPTVKVDIVPMSDAQVLESQIMMNFHRIDTTPSWPRSWVPRPSSSVPASASTASATPASAA